MVDAYVEILEKYLGINRTHFSIAERWKQCPPPEAQGKSLQEYINKACLEPLSRP